MSLMILTGPRIPNSPGSNHYWPDEEITDVPDWSAKGFRIMQYLPDGWQDRLRFGEKGIVAVVGVEFVVIDTDAGLGHPDGEVAHIAGREEQIA